MSEVGVAGLVAGIAESAELAGPAPSGFFAETLNS